MSRVFYTRARAMPPTTLKYEGSGTLPASVRVDIRRLTLVIEQGPDAGKSFGPLSEHTIVGRNPWCDVPLLDDRVSGQHCEIVVVGDYVHLRDLASTNGTFCSGLRVVDVILGSNVLVQVGDTVLRVKAEDGLQSVERSPADPTGKLIGLSAPMQRLFGMMRRVAPHDLPVLLMGETGTGKTAVASALHALSARAAKPFVAVNCGALPAELVESTLFGHVKGAFTGAHKSSQGIFEQAQGGSVLLDEIGEMPLALQPKLLSVLETRRVRPVGSEHEVPIDVRVFAATNRRLPADVAQGRFRQDLYFRLAGIELVLPPLRDRAEDLPHLAKAFLLRAVQRIQVEAQLPCLIRDISEAGLRRLASHSWPGNVRELENVILRAAALAEGSRLEPGDILLSSWAADGEALPMPLEEAPPPQEQRARPPDGFVSYKDFKADVVAHNEIAYFQQILDHAGGNVSRAAKLAGVSRTYLQMMLKKHKLRA
jgi:DNA-binding NtrC family response regulator